MINICSSLFSSLSHKFSLSLSLNSRQTRPKNHRALVSTAHNTLMLSALINKQDVESVTLHNCFICFQTGCFQVKQLKHSCYLPPVSQTRHKPCPRLKCMFELFYLKPTCMHLNISGPLFCLKMHTSTVF